MNKTEKGIFSTFKKTHPGQTSCKTVLNLDFKTCVKN